MQALGLYRFICTGTYWVHAGIVIQRNPIPLHKVSLLLVAGPCHCDCSPCFRQSLRTTLCAPRVLESGEVLIATHFRHVWYDTEDLVDAGGDAEVGRGRGREAPAA